MRRIRWAVIGCLMVIGTAVWAQRPIVPDGGFEAGTWTSGFPVNEGKDGTKCLKLVSGEKNVYSRTAIGTLNPGTKYRISAWLRTWNLKHNACYVRVTGVGTNGQVEPVGFWYPEIGDPGFPDIGQKENLIITGGSHPWHRFYTIMNRIPLGKKEFTLEIGLLANSQAGVRDDAQARDEFGRLGISDPKARSSGVAWVDDVRIEAVGPWPEPPPCAAAFEIHGEVGVKYFHGRTAEVGCLLTGFDPKVMCVRYRLVDGWGNLVEAKDTTPAAEPGGKHRFLIRHGGWGYFELWVLVEKGGQTYEAGKTSYAVLPKAADDYYREDPASPFGLWVALWDNQAGDMSLRDIGVKWTRGALPWGHWKFRNGRWEEYSPDFARGEIDRFRPQGINMLASAILRNTPREFSSAPESVLRGNPDAFGAYPPRDLADMKAYVRRNFEVYRGFPRAWGAWNEPSYPWCWRAGTSELVRCSEYFYKLCKQLDPKSIVVGPASGSWNVDFVEEFLRNGGDKTIDAVDIHFNSMAGDLETMGFAAKLRALKTGMKKYGGEKPIWIGEFGVNCYLPYCTELNQAWRLVKANVIGLSEGVRVMMTHCAYEWMPPDQNLWEAGCSLVRRDGTPRPAYAAYGVMTRQLYKSVYRGQAYGLPDSCVGYEFARDGKTVTVVWQKNMSAIEPWCKSPGRVVEQPPMTVNWPTRADRVKVIDLFGGETVLPAVNGQVRFKAGLAPVYIRPEK